MRDDLLDAQSAVDWAITQIPVLQDKFVSWNAKRPYEILPELDPQTGEHLLVAYLMGPLDPIVNAEVGVIINSIRTALDLLAASLCRRNGNKPSADTHFPIFPSEQAMIDPLTGIEGKKWLSNGERATIKALKPYDGGDHAIWPLHQLDILRKHERLVEARPGVSGMLWMGPRGRMVVIGSRALERLEDKTILHRSAEPLDLTQGHTHVAAFIVFNEPIIGLVDQEVAETLFRFSRRVAEIIKLLDT